MDLRSELDTTWVAAGGYGLLLALTVVLWRTPAASVYEISIYDAYPWYFWLLACLTIIVGVVVIVRSAASGTLDWVYGLGLLLSVVTLILLLPYFRGYVTFGRADVVTHIGFIRDIQRTAAVSQGNIYPNFHLLVLTLSYATGLSPATTIMSGGAIGSLFGIGSFFALVTELFDRRKALFTVPFAIVMVAPQSVPYLFSTLLLPFVLYLLVKQWKTRAVHVRGILAVALFALVIYHPITTLFVVFIFGIYGVARLTHRYRVFETATDRDQDPMGALPAAQLLISVFAVWYLDFAKIAERFAIVIENLTSPGGGGSPVAQYRSTVSQYTPALVDVVRILLVRYGQSAVLLSLGGLYSLVFLYTAVRERRPTDVFQSTFVSAFVVFFGLSVLFFFVDLIVGFGRPLLYAELFGALLAGSVFSSLLRYTDHRSLVHGLLYTSVALLVVCSVFGLYTSPYSIGENQQVTRAELEGTEWFLENRDTQDDLAEFGIDTYRFRDAVYGRETFSEDKVVSSDTAAIPRHFSYETNATLGSSYERDTYVVVTRAGRIFYEKIYPGYRQFWKFEPADFQRLSRDRTVSLVYDNGGYTVYRANATG